MAGLKSGLRTLRDAWRNGKGQRIGVSLISGLAGNPGQSTWTWTGNNTPGGVAYPASGSGPRLTTRQTLTGSLWFACPGSGSDLYLSGLVVNPGAQQGGGNHIFLDHIADMRVSATASNISTSGLTSTGRIAAGEACQVWIEYLGGALTPAAPGTIRTMTYTNHDGVANKVSPQFNLLGTSNAGYTALGGSNVPYGFFLPLADGDWGVKSVERTDLITAGNVNPEFAIVLVRPIISYRLTWQIDDSGNASTTDPGATDIVCGIDIPEIARIDPSCASHWLMFNRSGFYGDLRMVSV